MPNIDRDDEHATRYEMSDKVNIKPLPYEAAIASMLKDFERCVEAKSVDLHKFRLPDGREAIIQLSITTNEDELDWYEKDWEQK